MRADNVYSWIMEYYNKLPSLHTMLSIVEVVVVEVVVVEIVEVVEEEVFNSHYVTFVILSSAASFINQQHWVFVNTAIIRIYIASVQGFNLACLFYC